MRPGSALPSSRGPPRGLGWTLKRARRVHPGICLARAPGPLVSNATLAPRHMPVRRSGYARGARPWGCNTRRCQMSEATKHTAAERRAIDRAWSALERMACRSYKAERMMSDGLRLERRERSSTTSGRAMMVSSASEAWNARAETLFSYAEGCRLAALAAAEAHRVAPAVDWRRFKRLARLAGKAHWCAVHRSLDRIMERPCHRCEDRRQVRRDGVRDVRLIPCPVCTFSEGA